MKILFAASECVPFVKTGGLADVVGALPKQIIKAGEDVRVILPLYSAIDSKWRDQMEHVVFFYINLGWRRQYVGIEKLVYDGITFYFVDNKQYFQRNYIYGLGGRDYTVDSAKDVYNELRDMIENGKKVEQFKYIGLRSK